MKTRETPHTIDAVIVFPGAPHAEALCGGVERAAGARESARPVQRPGSVVIPTPRRSVDG
ncbi:hypothetical protein [Streptomyces sp. NPDC048496]|uniref:hypothetical protein n=1 Tax=Streptomyces sp. NPDC048496 TaxID=3365558 RepID=UPI00371F28DF